MKRPVSGDFSGAGEAVGKGGGRTAGHTWEMWVVLESGSGG